MEFDRFTVVFLTLRPDAPVLDDEASAALQDAHLAHLADLHDAGHPRARRTGPGRTLGTARGQGDPVDASGWSGVVLADSVPTFGRRRAGRLRVDNRTAMAAGRRVDWLGRIARADGDRTMMLDRALARYTARGWQIDDRTDFSAIIAKEWGPGYALMPLLVIAVGLVTLGLVNLSARYPSGPVSFKRRLLTIDQFGEIAVTKLESRGGQSTRYAH